MGQQSRQRFLKKRGSTWDTPNDTEHAHASDPVAIHGCQWLYQLFTRPTYSLHQCVKPACFNS